MNRVNSIKKSKHLNPVEPLLGILRFVLIAVFFIAFFFYLDFRVVSTRSWFSLVSPSESESAPPPGVLISSGRPGYFDEGSERCVIFDGNWNWDDSYPLYQSTDCSLMDNGFRCLENGRPDHFYTKWRWQPKHCNLPRFDAKAMLEKLRDRRLVFVGDSISRNQWESLLCMLASGVPNNDSNSIYEVNGNPISKHRGFLVFIFKEYNCTVEYYRAPYLVLQSRAPAMAPKEVRMTLRVDKLVWTSKLWKDADTDFNTLTGFSRGGKWNSGGRCLLQKLPEFGSLPVSYGPHYSTVSDVLSNRSEELQVKNLDVLNVTSMTSRRKDGHPSLYNLSPEAGPRSLHIQDCSHWCLPGVPDSWNELLYVLFLKRESVRLPNSTQPSEI
ncbi:hypothetical protein EZV62_010622 [Acer yangbiense]|uniref:Uncharacterized protein n=1 Tax=Acer yangbiense TaxID=1000413 RepID=A0A5C7I3Q2_9ROSI|nr:hypothetical protein EZV62_010622 [Acer yangbiense]